MAGMLDCQGCFTRVWPRRDGSCPACGADAKGMAGVVGVGEGPYRAGDVAQVGERASVDVTMGAQVPGVCFQCGAETDRFVRIEREVRRGGIPRWLIVGVLVTLVLGGVLLFVEWVLGAILLLTVFCAAIGTARAMFWHGERLPATEVSVVVARVPQCQACERGGPPEPSHVDYHRQAMTFVVPRPVADRIRRV